MNEEEILKRTKTNSDLETWEATHYDLNTTWGQGQGENETFWDTANTDENDHQLVFILAGVFSVCYLLAGVIACRCYWLYLKKRTAGTLGLREALRRGVKEEEEEDRGRGGGDEGDDPNDDNEFLDARCC